MKNKTTKRRLVG